MGAFHPVQYSNTYSLYRGGWRGINIEPDPEKQALFQEHRPRDTTLPLAISDAEGTVTFAVKGELSGIVNEQYFHQEQLENMRHIKVKTKPLCVVLAEHLPSGGLIDVLSVDCEGHDKVVLGSNDWEAYRPLLVLCEAFNAEGARHLEEFLTHQSYRRLAACGPTLIFEDMRERPDRPRSYH